MSKQISLKMFVYLCIGIKDPITKEGEGWDSIDWFNPATFVCLSEARISTLYVMVFSNPCCIGDRLV
jgi:hypothetical protein